MILAAWYVVHPTGHTWLAILMTIAGSYDIIQRLVKIAQVIKQYGGK